MGFGRRRHGWGYQNIKEPARTGPGQSIKQLSPTVRERIPGAHVNPGSIFRFLQSFDMFRHRALGDNSAQGTAEDAGQNTGTASLRAIFTPGTRLFPWWIPTKWPSGFRSIRKSEGGSRVS